MEIYPVLPGLSYGVKKTPTYRTAISEASGGQQYRVGHWGNPIFQFHLEYSILRDAGYKALGSPFDELKTLVGFFMARHGSLEDFLFKDPDDFGGLGLPLQIITDGNGNYWSPLQATVGTALGVPAKVDVTDLITGALSGGATLNIYDNGVLKTLGTDYAFNSATEGLQVVLTNSTTGLITNSYSFDGLFIQWLAPPAGPVTADFNFYFRVHFGNYQGTQRSQAGILDALELEKYLNQLWEAKTVEFESSRP